MRLGKGIWISGRPCERSAHFLACSPVKKSIFSIIQTDLSSTSLFHDALCMDVVFPGVFKVPIEVFGTNFRLKGFISIKNN
jgi:hypothetical protein